MIDDHDRDLVLDWAKRHPEIQEAWLYGSHARGEVDPNDIDLAVVVAGDNVVERQLVWMDASWTRELPKRFHVEWYDPEADLKIVGPAVEREGTTLYKAPR